LVGALKERVAADLLSSSSSVPREVLLARLTKGLCDNLSMTEDAARWAVESWSLALGEISSVEPERREPAPVEDTRAIAEQPTEKQKQLQQLQQQVGQVLQAPKLQVKPQAIDFGEVKSGAPMPSQKVDVQNIGGGELQWQAKTDASWLTLTKIYLTKHDRLIVRLMDVVGKHEGQIEIKSDGGMVTIPIKATVLKKKRTFWW
jgi:hypothetical protein